MISLYLENSIIGSLFRFFSPYFSTATRPTRFLLTWLVIAQVALQAIMGPLSRPRSKILRVAVSRIILSSEASKVKLVGNLVA